MPDARGGPTSNEEFHAILEGARIVQIGRDGHGTALALVLYLDNGWMVRIPIGEPGLDFTRYLPDQVQ